MKNLTKKAMMQCESTVVENETSSGGSSCGPVVLRKCWNVICKVEDVDGTRGSMSRIKM